MLSKTVIFILLASFLAFTINLLTHQHLLTSLLNSLILGLSVLLFKDYLVKSPSAFNLFLIISLAFIPLFSYLPDNQFISFLPLISLAFLFMHKRRESKMLILAFSLFFLIGNVYLSGIIQFPFYFESSQLIINSPELNLNILRHTQDALFLPYQARLIMYSKSIYFYAFLSNLFSFLTLRNLYDVLLIANLYPLFIGFFNFLKEEKFRYFCIIALLITALMTGLDRSTDKFQSIYLLSTFFIYMILVGVRNLNKKLYIILFLISIFILISPKI